MTRDEILNDSLIQVKDNGSTFTVFTREFTNEKLLAEINNSFGSFDNFKNKFKEAALSVFGSGYTWLVYTDDELKIINTPNQNSPIQFDLCPVLAIDVWEHAYYLKHYNLRADYIDDWFKVINWEQAEKNLSECIIY